jgi:hypothetical protein
MLNPHTICRWIGHRREGYSAGYYTDRRGRQRERWHSRCARCGTSDGAEVFRDGILERFGYRTLRRTAFRWLVALCFWWRTDCHDCGQPKVRRGRRVGDHSGCIPF